MFQLPLSPFFTFTSLIPTHLRMTVYFDALTFLSCSLSLSRSHVSASLFAVDNFFSPSVIRQPLCFVFFYPPQFSLIRKSLKVYSHPNWLSSKKKCENKPFKSVIGCRQPGSLMLRACDEWLQARDGKDSHQKISIIQRAREVAERNGLCVVYPWNFWLDHSWMY